MINYLRIVSVIAATICSTAALAQASKCQPGCVNTATQKCACQ